MEGLLGTFSALLRIAQVEGGSPRAEFRDVDLSGITETVADAFLPDAEHGGHTLAGEVVPGVTILGDQELLIQLLANLVENALRHTSPGTRIRVRLASVVGGSLLTVEDNGPGVPEEERARILQRFYRGEHSRTTPGNGLGLNLVAAVAELHGAELRVEDAGPGLRIAVLFADARRPRPEPRRISWRPQLL